jgi:hypothetical protein
MTGSRCGASSRWRGLGRRCLLRLGLSLATVFATCGVSNWAVAANATQRDFATPEQAVDALMAAVRSNDQPEQLRILGPSGEQLIHSGDRVADRAGRRMLIGAYDTAHRIEVEGASATLIVGQEDWALPIPVVKQAERWHFDTQASAQKIIDRRVGRNELNVIEVCRAYVAAQREYASKDRPGDGLHAYAQTFESHGGNHDGLYWEAAASEEQSPLGPLVASAHAEGYPGEGLHGHRSPYHGYYFRILKSQGNHAPGGAKNYIVGGHMSGGFALLAFPAKWGDSGVMTFLVNQDGIVFQKNLGPDTEKLARETTQYDPDLSWTTP